MKLTKENIKKIEVYLNFKKLTQIDLRNEVIDHMATEIENAMTEKDLDFVEAFNNSTKKWNLELQDYSSLWLGWAWVGPKLMMKKTVRKTKKMYLRTVIGMIFLSVIFYLVLLLNLSWIFESLTLVLGSLYLLVLVFILFFHFRMKNSGYQTSFRFLFKTQARGFAFMYLAFNPLIVDSHFISVEQPNFIFLLFFHSLLVLNAYNFYDLYKSHFETQKYVVA